jgi:serine/threonine-protein kinase
MAENPILNDRYRLIEQVGSGGMSVIYKAQDLELGRMVAVKVLRPSLVGDPEFLIRFKREAQAAANLSHPNIVTVHDVGQDGPKTHYIVMEYVPGQDLKKLIRAKGAFEVDAALAIIVEVCKGVGYAHRAGLVHCDVKPQNILVTPDNSIKVTDFGMQRRCSPTCKQMTWSGAVRITFPEQAAGGLLPCIGRVLDRYRAL